MSLFYKEQLRNGTIELLKELELNHDLWIYTTSLRSGLYVKSWFKFLDVNIHRVINYTEHQNVIMNNELYNVFSKVPKLFSIDLLIDDSEGVAIECKKQGSNCLILAPDDNNWIQLVRDAVTR